MVMNCFSSTTISSFHRRKIFSWVRCPLQIIRGQGLPESISPQQTVEDTPKYFPHVVRFDLKTSVALLLTEEKRKANLWFTARNKHWGGWRCFWKLIAGGLVRWKFLPQIMIFDDENKLSEADSPLENQINFAYTLSKLFSKPILLSEISQSSWQMTLRWRCNYLNLWGQRDRWKMILQIKIQNNSSFQKRKNDFDRGCCSENHSRSCHSPAINPSLKLILIWDFPFLM